MYPPAPDLSSARVQSWRDGELFWQIRKGVRLTGMPAWEKTLSEEDTEKLVQYIRSLPALNRASAELQRIASAPGKTLSQQAAEGRFVVEHEGCLNCHWLHGMGAHIGPDLGLEWSRNRSNEWLAGHFKNPSGYTPGSSMPSFAYLTEDQRRSLIVLLQQPSN